MTAIIPISKLKKSRSDFYAQSQQLESATVGQERGDVLLYRTLLVPHQQPQLPWPLSSAVTSERYGGKRVETASAIAVVPSPQS